MNARAVVKSAPNSIIVLCVTFMAMAVLGALTFLVSQGKDVEEISRYVNTLLNFLAVIGIGGLGLGVASAATTANEAKNAAQKTVEQTNGVLTDRIAEAVANALAERDRQNQEDSPDV